MLTQASLIRSSDNVAYPFRCFLPLLLLLLLKRTLWGQIIYVEVKFPRQISKVGGIEPSPTICAFSTLGFQLNLLFFFCAVQKHFVYISSPQLRKSPNVTHLFVKYIYITALLHPQI